MRFPTQHLKPIDGEVYCHVFENSLTGLKRGLYWSFLVHFAPVSFASEEWSCSLTSEWIQFPGRRLTELAGVTSEDFMEPEKVETSFYVAAHHCAELTRFEVGSVGATMQVCIEARVSLEGYEVPTEELVSVQARAVLPFTGIIVIPGSLAPIPETADAVSQAAAAFISLDDFEQPEWDRFRYILPPRLG